MLRCALLLLRVNHARTKEDVMVNRAHQLRLDLGDQLLWDQLEEGARQRSVSLLSQLLQEIWRDEKDREDQEQHHEGEASHD